MGLCDCQFQVSRHMSSRSYSALDRGQIAGAARGDLVRDGDAVDALKGLHHVQHAVSVAGAEVEDIFAAVIHHIVDGGDVAAGEVDDMDIVAHAGSVRRVVVVAEDVQMVPAPDGDLRDKPLPYRGESARTCILSSRRGWCTCPCGRSRAAACRCRRNRRWPRTRRQCSSRRGHAWPRTDGPWRRGCCHSTPAASEPIRRPLSARQSEWRSRSHAFQKCGPARRGCGHPPRRR